MKTTQTALVGLVASSIVGIAHNAHAASTRLISLSTGAPVAGQRSGGASWLFTNSDTSGADTITIRVLNTMAANATSGPNDLSGMFWTFTGLSALDMHTGSGNQSTSDFASVGTDNGGIHNPDDGGLNAKQMWGFHDPSVSWSGPNGALQGLGAAGLGGLFAGNNGAMQGGASENQLNGPDGTIIWNAVAEHGNAGNDPSDQQFLGWVEFVFNVSDSYFGSMNLATANIGISNASIQWDTTGSSSDNQLLIVPLPPGAYAGLGTLAGLAGISYFRRQKQAAV